MGNGSGRQGRSAAGREEDLKPEGNIMGIRLQVDNFRCLRKVDWSPDGVCVVVGPNDAGKTTLLDAMSFLRLAYKGDFGQAVTGAGGQYFRNLDAPPNEPVAFSLSQGPCKWDLSISHAAGPFNLAVGERLTEGDETVFLKRQGEPTASFLNGQMSWAGQVGLQLWTNPAFAQQRPLTAAMKQFLSTVSGFVIYGGYGLQQLRQNGSPLSTDMQLSANGQNAFAVLRNWRDKKAYQPAYEFVVKQLCQAFPGVSDDIEFDFAGQITSLRLVDSRRTSTIPVALAAHGWLAGLLHLMAVAGAEPGTVIAIDEFENSLHPYAIRHLVQAMRYWASRKQLTVLLAGHSSALLDEFHEYPAQVFVMDPSEGEGKPMPIRLTDYRDPEWLKHFSLGELYRHEDFGAPKNTASDARETVSVS
jgi:energy-coupling factor transporter ATP-binding protein EcfA2